MEKDEHALQSLGGFWISEGDTEISTKLRVSSVDLDKAKRTFDSNFVPSLGKNETPYLTLQQYVNMYESKILIRTDLATLSDLMKNMLAAVTDHSVEHQIEIRRYYSVLQKRIEMKVGRRGFHFGQSWKHQATMGAKETCRSLLEW